MSCLFCDFDVGSCVAATLVALWFDLRCRYSRCEEPEVAEEAMTNFVRPCAQDAEEH